MTDQQAELQRAAAELRDLIREAHQVTKDLRAERALARDAFKELAVDSMNTVVEASKDAFGTALNRSLDDTIACVNRHVERLTTLVLTGRRDGVLPVGEADAATLLQRMNDERRAQEELLVNSVFMGAGSARHGPLGAGMASASIDGHSHDPTISSGLHPTPSPTRPDRKKRKKR